MNAAHMAHSGVSDRLRQQARNAFPANINNETLSGTVCLQL